MVRQGQDEESGALAYLVTENPRVYFDSMHDSTLLLLLWCFTVRVLLQAGIKARRTHLFKRTEKPSLLVDETSMCLQ